MASRLSENPDVTVLLLEAGGSDDVAEVRQPASWPANLGSTRDWGFTSKPTKYLNGRSLLLSMGKVLGGGSSINVMVWARGHRSDWDHFAAESGCPAWNYDSVLEIYRRIEDWHGTPDPEYRGKGGPVFVQPAPDPNPLAPAILAATSAFGIPTFGHQNGLMMEGVAGASILDLCVRDGHRRSIFRSYVMPVIDRANLTVLTGARVTRLASRGGIISGVEFRWRGVSQSVRAGAEVVLSLGAINTPKVLMQSGIGDHQQLQRHGIPVVQHLPGVGRNFQDHPRLESVWEHRFPVAPRNNGAEVTYFWGSTPGLTSPDVQTCVAETPIASRENGVRYGMPEYGWTLIAGVVAPKSRGHIELTGPDPDDAVCIEANMLSAPEDLRTAVAAVELSRQIGNSPEMRPFALREVMPGPLKGVELEQYIREAAQTYWHQCGTAKMGRDAMSVVDGELSVHGVQNLRVADASIMPRVTTGNTMAPCVVIGERAADILRIEHSL